MITASGEGSTLTSDTVHGFSGEVATFIDPNTSATAGEYSALINWGDNTPQSTGTVSADGIPGKFSVTGSHTYHQPSGNTPYKITVTIVDNDNGQPNQQVNDQMTVTQGPASAITPGPRAATFTGGTEGFQATQVRAYFADTNKNDTAAQLTATINWGDGTTSGGTVSGSRGSFTVSGSHTYANEGQHMVTVTLSRNATSQVDTASQSGQATVADARLSASPVTPQGTGPSYSALATFTDQDIHEPDAPAQEYSATIYFCGTTAQNAMATATGTVTATSTPGRFTVSGTNPSGGTTGTVKSCRTTVVIKDVDGTSTATATTTTRYET